MHLVEQAVRSYSILLAVERLDIFGTTTPNALDEPLWLLPFFKAVGGTHTREMSRQRAVPHRTGSSVSCMLSQGHTAGIGVYCAERVLIWQHCRK